MTTAHTITTTPPGLAGLAGSWATHLAAQRKAPGTIRAYTGAAAAFTRWHEIAAPGLPVTAASLDRKTCSAFLADLLAAGAAPATARARYQGLRQFAAWLAAEGETDADLLLGMRPPKLDQAPVDSVSDAEPAALLRACHAPPGAGRWQQFEALRDEAAVRLLADTGMRAGELIALTVADVDLARRLVTIRRAKGGRYRVSVFGPDAARAVDRYLRRARKGHRLAVAGRLFLGTSGRGWSYSALRGALANLDSRGAGRSGDLASFVLLTWEDALTSTSLPE